MEFTGERVIPGQVDADLWAEHLSRYALAARAVQRISPTPKVLDVGCGAGYGTARLAEASSVAYGFDVAPDAAVAAQRQYGNTNTKYLAASATAIPFAEKTFDVVTAYEVIEHIENWDSLLAEAARVLKKSGLFYVSTPNVEYYTESRGAAGANPFHVHEFQYNEFRTALEKHFAHTRILLQDHTEGFAFRPAAESHTGDVLFDSVFGKPEEANFFIGICSHSLLPPIADFVFIPRAGNLLRERERHVTAVNQEIAETRAQFRALHEAHEQLGKSAVEEMNTARQIIAGLEGDVEERTRWATNTQTELDSARTHITELHQLVEERTQWALKTNAELETARAKIAHVQASRWMKLGKKLGLGPKLDSADKAD